MKSWIAALFGGFAAFVAAAFTLLSSPSADVRALIYLIVCGAGGAGVGWLAFYRREWIHRGAGWQLLWTTLVGASTGFVLSIVSWLVGITASAESVKAILTWTVVGACAGFAGAVAVWFQMGEVPFQQQK